MIDSTVLSPSPITTTIISYWNIIVTDAKASPLSLTPSIQAPDMYVTMAYPANVTPEPKTTRRAEIPPWPWSLNSSSIMSTSSTTTTDSNDTALILGLGLGIGAGVLDLPSPTIPPEPEPEVTPPPPGTGPVPQTTPAPIGIMWCHGCAPHGPTFTSIGTAIYPIVPCWSPWWMVRLSKLLCHDRE